MSIGISAALGAEVERLRHDAERYQQCMRDLAGEIERLRTALDSVRFFLTSDGESKAEAFARLRQILDAMEEGK